MSSKIKIKMGQIEVEYEGPESFLKEELPALLNAVSELYLKGNFSENVLQESSHISDDSSSHPVKHNEIYSGTTGSIAAKLKCSVAQDLVLAAAAHLALVKGIGKMPRKQIIDEMRSATGYFKTTYVNNLTTVR
jgi:hypothetical protein